MVRKVKSAVLYLRDVNTLGVRPFSLRRFQSGSSVSLEVLVSPIDYPYQDPGDSDLRQGETSGD